MSTINWTPVPLRFGADSSRDLAQLSATAGKRIVLVTGARALAASGRLATWLADWSEHDCHVTRIVVDREPDDALIDDARRRATAAEVIVGVGGGSVLDSARALAALAAAEKPTRHYLEHVPGCDSLPLPATRLPLFLAPTTAGTGAEASHNAVIGVPDHAIKRSLRGPHLVPDLAVVDPGLIALCPRPIAAACAFDALTHNLEAYCSQRAHPYSDALALPGLAAAWQALAALEAGDDWATTAAWAAHWGGVALAHAGLGAVHGLVAPLGGLRPVPHGLGCAALLPGALIANEAASMASDTPRRRLSEACRILTDGASDRAADAADAVQRRYRALDLPGLAAYGVKAGDIDHIVDHPSGSLRSNPVRLARGELAAIVETALQLA